MGGESLRAVLLRVHAIAVRVPVPSDPTLRRHTLAATWTTIESVSGVALTDAYVGQPRSGVDNEGVVSRLRPAARSAPASFLVHVAGQGYANRSRSERRRRRRRTAIEPKIGHLKSDHRMDRRFLARLGGDAINAVLAAAGSNLRKLLRRLSAALIQWLNWVTATSRLDLQLSLRG